MIQSRIYIRFMMKLYSDFTSDSLSKSDKDIFLHVNKVTEKISKIETFS